MKDCTFGEALKETRIVIIFLFLHKLFPLAYIINLSHTELERPVIVRKKTSKEGFIKELDKTYKLVQFNQLFRLDNPA